MVKLKKLQVEIPTKQSNSKYLCPPRRDCGPKRVNTWYGMYHVCHRVRIIRKIYTWYQGTYVARTYQVLVARMHSRTYEPCIYLDCRRAYVVHFVPSTMKMLSTLLLLQIHSSVFRGTIVNRNVFRGTIVNRNKYCQTDNYIPW